MIEVAHASFWYDDGTRVLDDVSLTVTPGERTVLLGANGSGKSTLARMLNGALVPREGAVRVDDVASGPGARRDLSRLVGYVRQDPRNQIVSSLVSDEVAFGPRNLGLAREEVLARVDEALATCGIEGLRDRVTTELSGGQQQLLALAGVIAMRPRYLVLDEVGAHLDAVARERVSEVVRRLLGRGVGVLEIAHAAESLFGADHVAVLRAGRIAWEGGPQGLLSSPGALSMVDLGEEGRVLTRAVAAGFEVGERCDEGALAAALRRAGGLGEKDAPAASAVAPASPHGLSLDGVSCSYGDVRALRDVTVGPLGGVTLLVGRSGSGKTTSALVAAGVLAPDAGRALLDGRTVRAGMVGLAFQRSEDQLFADTVLDDIAYAPRMAGTGEGEALAAARAAAGRLGVDEALLDRSPFELSGGQARRVALAGVVAGSCAAYVLDEPTAGLDARARASLVRLAGELAREGAAVVVVTHDPAEWLGVAREVVFLRAGEVTARVPGRRAARDAAPYAAAGLRAPLLVRLRARLEGARDA